MDALIRHRYVAALVATGTLLLFGTLMVVNRSAVTPANNYNTLDISGVIQATDPAVKIPGTPEPVRPTAVDLPYTKVNTQTKTPPPPPPKSDFFDWDSFVNALTRSSSQTVNTTDPSLSDAYAFVPTGLITPQEDHSKDLSESQKVLYGWGSDVGSVIQSYEDSHPDQVATLTNFIQDREDAGKIAAMKKLGSDLQAVGNSIESVAYIPPQMSMAGPALADAYREIGRNLAVIPDAKGDEALVKAILTYNKSAEDFVQKFVAVVLIFQANDVKYTQNEPGSVFMFPSN